MNALNQRLSLQLEQAGVGGARQVLVVEGSGDTAFLTAMLDKPPFRKMNLLKHFVIVDAGGKDAVLKTLSVKPKYRAIVDRDTWTDKECKRMLKRYPGLYILPRFCIENYIICPDELAIAFPNLKGLGAITDAIDTGIRHGCLWRAAQPLYDELIQAGFNKALLAFPPPDAVGIRQLTDLWQSILSQSHIESQMEEIYSEQRNSDPMELLRTFVHGKVFWKGVVEKWVAPLYPEVTGERLKTVMLRRISMPSDLNHFLQEVFYECKRKSG